MSSRALQALANLSRRVLCTFHRALFDPLRKSFLSDRDFGGYLYEHFLIDVPKMFDLASMCVRVAQCSSELLLCAVPYAAGLVQVRSCP